MKEYRQFKKKKNFTDQSSMKPIDESTEKFSPHFRLICRWIINTGYISYEKAPLILSLSQLLWKGNVDLNQIPSDTTLRNWETVFAEVEKKKLHELLKGKTVNISTDLSKRNEEVI
jgi:hypothetical protein